MSNGTFLYPNVTSLPTQTGESSSPLEKKRTDGVPTEFDRVFDKAISEKSVVEKSDLNQIRAPLRFSAHASQRLKDRKIAIDPMTMGKINDAVDRAESKGVQDTLILTPDAALIVNVTNRTVVTALDRKAAAGNIFTNIDGAVVI